MTGIAEWKLDNKAVAMDHFRIEYTSIHMNKNSLFLSPNNMKFQVDRRLMINYFWNILLDED